MSNKRNQMKVNLFLLVGVFFLLVVPLTAQAVSMPEAVEQATLALAQGKIAENPDKKIIVQVVNRASQQTDDLSRRVETELYKSLSKTFPRFELISLSEAQTGVNLAKVLVVKGETEPKSALVSLKLTATVGMKGTLLAQAQTEFENLNKLNKQLVAVLPLEGKDLSSGQRNAFSDAFQSAIAQSGEYELASSAEVAKMSPDQIQKVQECTRDECATIIGAQLGVDRVISSTVSKIGEGRYQVSAKVLGVKDGVILKTATADHQGPLADLKPTLLKLVAQLTNRQTAGLGVEAMLAAQAQARSEEIAQIAAEQDRVKKAQLENEASWREIARQAELNRAKWVVIDESLSLEKAIAEADALRAEFAATEKKFEAQWKKSQANLASADKIEKDPFETQVEFKERVQKEKVAQALRKQNQKITYLSQKIEVLEPFEQRLAELSSKRFTLPEVKLGASLGAPNAEKEFFPLTISLGKKSWAGAWPYEDKEKARTLWATKELITVQAKAALSEKGKGKTGYKLAEAEVLHPGLALKTNIPLETPAPFPEIAILNRLRTELAAKAQAEAEAAVTLKQALSRGLVFHQPKTNLIWPIGIEDPLKKWQAAIDYCQALTYAGFADWRLPNKKELESIYQYQASNPEGKEVLNFVSDVYWSSTTYALSSTDAWYVDFSNGYVNYSYKTSKYYVRCVR